MHKKQNKNKQTMDFLLILTWFYKNDFYEWLPAILNTNNMVDTRRRILAAIL